LPRPAWTGPKNQGGLRRISPALPPGCQCKNAVPAAPTRALPLNRAAPALNADHMGYRTDKPCRCNLPMCWCVDCRNDSG
jgi:hypothetical protein